MIKKLLAGAIMVLAGCTPEFNNTFQAAHTGADLRTRLVTNASLESDGFRAGYQGVNEVNNFDSDTYGGKQVGYAGTDDLAPAVIMKANSREVKSLKGGIRNTSLAELIGCGGPIDLTANDESVELAIDLGIPVTEKFILGFYQELEMDYDGKASAYTEIQPMYKITDNFKVFMRAEAKDFDFRKATYMVGGMFDF